MHYYLTKVKHLLQYFPQKIPHLGDFSVNLSHWVEYRQMLLSHQRPHQQT